MDLFVDVVAVLSMPGIFCVLVGQGVIGVGMPFVLVVGLLAPPS